MLRNESISQSSNEIKLICVQLGQDAEKYRNEIKQSAGKFGRTIHKCIP